MGQRAPNRLVTARPQGPKLVGAALGALLVAFVNVFAMAPGMAPGMAPAAGAIVPSGHRGSWVIVRGRGFGHGVGMAQDGAYWMARQGRSAGEILRWFYPGTSLGQRGGNVRVPLGGASAVRLDLPSGGTVADQPVSDGSSVTVRAEQGQLVATIASPTGAASFSSAPSLAMTRVAFRLQTAAVDSAPNSSEAPAPSSSIVLAPNEPSQDAPADAPTTATTSTVATTTTTATTATTLASTVRGALLVVAPTDGALVLYGGKPYRGQIELTQGGGVRVVNELNVEQYLRGMGEITDSRWPMAALEAQAIAARTYAFRTMAATGEVCPTQRCQVYIGARAEYAAMDNAVAATRGKVVTYDAGKLAVTFYSASGGGTIASPEEAFGAKSNVSYLQPGTYPTGDLKSWVVTLTIEELGRRVGYSGTARGVAITKVGPSGRAVEVTVSGTAAPLVVSGPHFDTALGLRSTLFTVEQAASPVFADPDGEAVDVVPAGRTDASAGIGGSATDPVGVPPEFSQSGLLPDDPSVVTGDPIVSGVSDETVAETGPGTTVTTQMAGAKSATRRTRSAVSAPTAGAVEAGPVHARSSSAAPEAALVAILSLPVFVLLTGVRRRCRRRP